MGRLFCTMYSSELKMDSLVWVLCYEQPEAWHAVDFTVLLAVFPVGPGGPGGPWGPVAPWKWQKSMINSNQRLSEQTRECTDHTQRQKFKKCSRKYPLPHPVPSPSNVVTGPQPPICHQYKMAPVNTVHRIDWDRQLRRLRFQLIDQVIYTPTITCS